MVLPLLGNAPSSAPWQTPAQRSEPTESHIHTHRNTHTLIHTTTYTHVHTHTQIHTYTYTHTHTYTQVHTHIHIHRNTYTHIHKLFYLARQLGVCLSLLLELTFKNSHFMGYHSGQSGDKPAMVCPHQALAASRWLVSPCRWGASTVLLCTHCRTLLGSAVKVSCFSLMCLPRLPSLAGAQCMSAGWTSLHRPRWQC